MPITPVAAQLVNAGDKLTTLMNGDPTAMISLTGTFTNAVVVLEAVPFGQSQFIPIADVNVQTGQIQQVSAAGIGPLTNVGPGGGYILKVDSGGFSQLQVRRVDNQGGAITGVIATLPFPTTPSGNLIQIVAGTVSVAPSVTAAAGDGMASSLVPETGVGLQAGAFVNRLREAGVGSGAALVGNPEEGRLLEVIALELIRIRVGIGELANVDDLDQRVTLDDVYALVN